MPSINSKKESIINTYATSSKVSKTHLSTIMASRMDNTPGDFGIVNYINGVPVSIQLPRHYNNLAGSSWKENMQRRNNKLQEQDVNKMYNRNISEKKQLQNALPLIGNQAGFGKIQAGFFNSKR